MTYTSHSTKLPGVLILEPRIYGDARGFFHESYSRKDFAEASGCDVDFVQDNHSRSGRGVLRGLHYQLVRPQGKLVRVTSGEVFDVAVDMRRGSPDFGKWTGVMLSADNHLLLWIPPGFAHGFMVLSESADFLYKTTDYWYPEHERSVLWNDASLGIVWPQNIVPQLSGKDAAAPPFTLAEVYHDQ